MEIILLLWTDHRAQMLITPAGAIWASRASLLNRQGAEGKDWTNCPLELKVPEGLSILHVAGPLDD